MSEGPVKRIPTGVADFDTIVRGGLPAGSVVLLLGDVGAGQLEFALTSAARLGLAKTYPETRDFFLGRGAREGVLPRQMCYVTFSRAKEDILRDVQISFNRDYHESLATNLLFKDFSRSYFMHTLVPTSWVGGPDDGSGLFAETGAEERSLLEALVAFLEKEAPDSLVVIDSLTDLVISERIQFGDVVAFLKGLQRMAKSWGALLYLLLTQDILDKKRQQMIIDAVDGVLVFEWSKYHHTSKRQRYLYVEKFMSVLPHLDQERISRFATIVTAQSGFVVINTERVA